MSPAARGSAGVPAWPSTAVERLCGDDARFERVPADEAFAHRMLDQLADDGEVWLFAAARGRLPKAHTLSYDAARKSVRVVLGSSWRAKSCTSRSPMPASRAIVIAECRRLCGVIRRSIPILRHNALTR